MVRPVSPVRPPCNSSVAARARRRMPARRAAQARVAEGPRARLGELPAAEGPDARPRAAHGLRGSPLPEHRRVLAPRHGDVHDPRRRLHALLRLLRRHARRARPARPRRAGRSASAVATLGLDYVVITSVDRDDLAGLRRGDFARHDRARRARGSRVPRRGADPRLPGRRSGARIVLDARPDVLNHNIETVPRLYRMARPGGRYDARSSCSTAPRRIAPEIPTKSGLMVGLGEKWDELVATLATCARPAARSSRSASTCGRRSRTCRWSATTRPTSSPSSSALALEHGFGHVESGPLVRSSYHAHEQADAYAGLRSVEPRRSTLRPSPVAIRAHRRTHRHLRRVPAPSRLLPAHRPREAAAYRRRHLLGEAGARIRRSERAHPLVGLAPAAHGANRTGPRVHRRRPRRFGRLPDDAPFTRTASRVSRLPSADDGLSCRTVDRRRGALRAARQQAGAGRNRRAAMRTSRRSSRRCRVCRVMVPLGRLAFDACWRLLVERGPHPCITAGLRTWRGLPNRRQPPTLVTSHRPSRQNAQTGRLTPPMMDAVFARARRVIG